MSKNEFLDRLFQLLSDLSPEERDEAIAYYREYIEDAGFGNEGKILEELGTPEGVAAEIKSGMANKDNQDINYSSNTVKDSPEPYPFSGQGSGQNKHTYYYNQENPNAVVSKKGLNKPVIILIIIALVFLSPLWIGLAGTLIGVLFALLAAIFGIIVVCAAIGIVCFFAGIVLIIGGFTSLIALPILGFALIGAGLIVTAIAILLLLLTGCICFDVIPWAVRTISNLIHGFKNRNKEAQV